MKKLVSIILIISFITTIAPATVSASNLTLNLIEQWQLTSDYDLAVPYGDTLVINGENTYYIYEMGGRLINSGSGTVYLQNTLIYAQGDNPEEHSLAELSKTARTLSSYYTQSITSSLSLASGVSIKSSSNTNIITLGGTVYRQGMRILRQSTVNIQNL